MTDPGFRILSITDVCAATGAKEHDVRVAISKGDLRAKRKGKRILTTTAWVQDWFLNRLPDVVDPDGW